MQPFPSNSDGSISSWEKCWQEVHQNRKQDGALFSPSGEVLATFADLEKDSDQLAARWKKSIRLGSVVAFSLPNQMEWPSVLLAIWKLEAIPLLLPASPGSAPLQTTEILAGAEWRVTPAGGGGRELQLEKLSHQPVQFPWHSALFKVTSGTTGQPKLIGFTHAQLFADAKQVCATMGIGQDDRNYGVIPFSHSYGFSNLITPLLFLGIPLVVADDPMPYAVALGLKQSHATVWPTVPAMIPALLETGFSGVTSLRTCISAGAPLPSVLALKFFQQTGCRLHSFYGSSECGGICYDRQGEASEKEGWVGQPLEGVKIELLDGPKPSTEEPARLVVSSAAVGLGYFPSDPQDPMGDGKFHPPDLAVRVGDGFCLRGRVGDGINVGGKKVHPAEIESALLEIEGVTQAVVFGRKRRGGSEESICALVEGAASEETIRSQLAAKLPLWKCPRELIRVEKIPVNERGKINRRELAEKF